MKIYFPMYLYTAYWSNTITLINKKTSIKVTFIGYKF